MSESELIQEIVNALQMLLDAQNGPPLEAPRHKEFWGKAEKMSILALKKAEQMGYTYQDK